MIRFVKNDILKIIRHWFEAKMAPTYHNAKINYRF